MTNKVYKLFIVTLCCLVAVLSLPCYHANAEMDYSTHEIPELVMTIDIPSDVSVITSSVKKNDELFKNGTFDYIDAMTKMRNDDAFLYGKSVRDEYELEVIGVENRDHVKNLSKLNEKKQNSLLKDYSEQPDVVESKIYSNGYLTYFYSSRTLNTGSQRFFFSDYYTIYNGYDITVRIISENDNIKDSELDILKHSADSIRFPEKRPFSFSKLRGRGLFVTFFVVAVGFVLIFLYRRHDEAFNTWALDCAEKLMVKYDKVKNQKNLNGIKSKSENELSEISTKDNNSESIQEAPEKNESIETDNSDDEDISSIDLDEAIAFFDDSL